MKNFLYVIMFTFFLFGCGGVKEALDKIDLGFDLKSSLVQSLKDELFRQVAPQFDPSSFELNQLSGDNYWLITKGASEYCYRTSFLRNHPEEFNVGYKKLSYQYCTRSDVDPLYLDLDAFETRVSEIKEVIRDQEKREKFLLDFALRSGASLLSQNFSFFLR